MKNVLAVIAIVAILIAFINFSISFSRFVHLRNVLTALVTSEGYVNLSVSTTANVNFSVNTLNFGAGTHDAGTTTNASLDSTGTTSTRGNWSWSNQRLILDNVGNVNVSLNLSAGKTAAAFLGGNSPGYWWNISNSDAAACANTSATDRWLATTTTETYFCSRLGHGGIANSIRIDILLHVPVDAAGQGTWKGDTITAKGTV